MGHIFVSFAGPDSEFANALKQELTGNGFEVRDESNGADTADTLDLNIREALAVVVVLSTASILMSEVSYQWAFAIGSSVPVIPILVRISEGDLHPRLNTLQHLNFSEGEDQPWEALISALRRIEARQGSFTLRAPANAPAIVQVAAQALDDADPEVREAALSTLDDMDHPAAIELLAQALRHPIDQVRFGAVTQLARHNDLRALPVLIEEIRAGREGMNAGMLAMGPESIPLLAKALEDDDPDVCTFAARALGQVGGSASVVALMDSLNGKGSANRRQVLYALEDAGEQAAIPVLISAVRDPDREVRVAAVSALVKCGARANTLAALIPLFIEALEDEYDQVGIKACGGLELSGDPQAIPALTRGAVSIEDPQVRIFCRSALKRMQADVSPLLRERAKACSPLEFQRIFSLLSEFKDEANVPLLIEGTRHADPSIRVSAVNGLEQCRGSAPVAALLERLEDDDEFVRTRALASLSNIKDPACVARLKDFLYDEEIGKSVATILENIATMEARIALRSWKDKCKK